MIGTVSLKKRIQKYNLLFFLFFHKQLKTANCFLLHGQKTGTYIDSPSHTIVAECKTVWECKMVLPVSLSFEQRNSALSLCNCTNSLRDSNWLFSTHKCRTLVTRPSIATTGNAWEWIRERYGAAFRRSQLLLSQHMIYCWNFKRMSG